MSKPKQVTDPTLRAKDRVIHKDKTWIMNGWNEDGSLHLVQINIEQEVIKRTYVSQAVIKYLKDSLGGE